MLYYTLKQEILHPAGVSPDIGQSIFFSFFFKKNIYIYRKRPFLFFPLASYIFLAGEKVEGRQSSGQQAPSYSPKENPREYIHYIHSRNNRSITNRSIADFLLISTDCIV